VTPAYRKRLGRTRGHATPVGNLRGALAYRVGQIGDGLARRDRTATAARGA
jgi:hypothetical protein